MDRNVEIRRKQRTRNFPQWGHREGESPTNEGKVAGSGTHAEQLTVKQGLPGGWECQPSRQSPSWRDSYHEFCNSICKEPSEFALFSFESLL